MITLATYNSLYMDGDYTEYQNGFFNGLERGRSRTRSSIASTSDDTPVDLTAWRDLPEKPGCYLMTGIQADDFPGGLWPKLNGEFIAMFSIVNNGRRTLYAVPARVNGNECNIIVLISARNPKGRILGIRQNDGLIIQKGIEDIKAEDEILLYYKEYNFTDKTEEWIIGAEISALDGLELGWAALEPEMYVSTQFADAYGNLSYTQPVKAY